MLLLWRQAFTILLNCVWLAHILLQHIANKFDVTRFLKIFQFAIKSVLAPSRGFLHYTYPGWAPHIYIQILSVWGKTSKSALRSMYNKRTASTHTICFFLVYSSSVTKWLPASVSITTVTERRLPKRHRDERSCSRFAGQFNSLEYRWQSKEHLERLDHASEDVHHNATPTFP